MRRREEENNSTLFELVNGYVLLLVESKTIMWMLRIYETRVIIRTTDKE